MPLIKTPEEIKILREGGKILARILNFLAGEVRPGISTWNLEILARAQIKKTGVSAAFPGYKLSRNLPPYPAALCTSINHEVVHGIPKKGRLLKEGDIIGLDLGISFKGLFSDAAITLPVGKIDAKAQKLLEVTKRALEAGIEQVKPGNTIGDVAAAIQKEADEAGYGIVRDLGGHGVGHAIHEDPFVPNFGKPHTLARLAPGMVLAIEPMFTLGDYEINFLDDGWTVVTADGSLSAHFEHTVAVTDSGYLILTEP